jgi:protein farnesyltransferase/geranylgeranyltransferase type-1 subunit alpha
LHALNSSLVDELDYIRVYTQESPKNYQLWQHRQIIVERLGRAVAAEDLDVSGESLKTDPKNIHCWQYRQWLLRRFDMWGEDEWRLTEELIDEDEFNNSAWNHRSFLLKHETAMASDTKEGLEIELHWSLDHLLNKSSGCNESVWNYIMWLIELPELADAKDELFLKLECKFGAWMDSKVSLYIRFLLLTGMISGKGDVQAACSILTSLAPMQRNFWAFLSGS